MFEKYFQNLILRNLLFLESHTGVEDMEMSDEELGVPSTSAAKPPNYIAPLPSVAPLDPRLQVCKYSRSDRL